MTPEEAQTVRLGAIVRLYGKPGRVTGIEAQRPTPDGLPVRYFRVVLHDDTPYGWTSQLTLELIDPNPPPAPKRYTIEQRDEDGTGSKPYRVYHLPPTYDHDDPYWSAVTDVPCPVLSCVGTIRWHEAGYVGGYRRCDTCHRHFRARGTIHAPTLVRLKQQY